MRTHSRPSRRIRTLPPLARGGRGDRAAMWTDAPPTARQLPSPLAGEGPGMGGRTSLVSAKRTTPVLPPYSRGGRGGSSVRGLSDHHSTRPPLPPLAKGGRRGFTLIELLVVIAILLALTA